MNNLEYLKWLCDRVGLSFSRYTNLARYLYRTPFVWSGRIPTDANRASDGVILRYVFEGETRLESPDMRLDCNVLEMLVAFAERIDAIMGEPGEIHYDVWFETMIGNLGLLELTNDDFDERRADEIISRWMHRDIDYSGYGGLFPIRHPMEDQRDLSIWDQMSCYMNENY